MEPTRERFSFENDPSDREDRPPPSRTAGSQRLSITMSTVIPFGCYAEIRSSLG